jgi:hypothetical protein
VKDSTGVEERRQTTGVSRENVETWGDSMTRKKEETKKEIDIFTEKYRRKQKASKKHGTRKSTGLFGVTF